MSQRLSTKVRKSFVIKSNHNELGEVLAELLKTMDIDELHIMTYKDRIDVYATKTMKPLHVELYEKLFSLTDDDIDKAEEYKKRIISCTKE
jgi:predicted ATP-binding protein involved in virulence